MTEAGIDIFIATAATLALTIAIYFGERAYRKGLERKEKHGELMVSDTKVKVTPRVNFFITFF